MRLLHIDNDLDYTRTLRGELLRNGAVLCELEAATDLDQACSLLADRSFDAVLLDPTSWGRDRLEICSAVCEVSAQAPVVILSVADDDLAVVNTVLAGAHDYLTKDEADGAWLMRRVRYAIERGKHHAEHHRCSRPHQLARAAVGAQHGTHGALGEPGPWVPKASTEPTSDETSSDPRAMDWQNREVRLLHVEDDPSFARMFAKLLSKTLAMRFHVETAETLSDAIDRVSNQDIDAILLDLSLPDSRGLATLRNLVEYSGDLQVLVCTGRDDDATAIDGMALGAEDFLIKTQSHLRYMPRAVQMAIARRSRPRTLEGATPTTGDKPVAHTVPAQIEHHVGRRHPRYILTRPMFAVPILPDASPAAGHSADGISVDVSEGGLRFEIARLDRLPTQHLLVGVEAADGVLHFATVEAVRVETTSLGLTVGARFEEGNRDLLRPENLQPKFNPQNFGYATGLSVAVLDQWVDFGILRPMLVDRILLCPRCQAVPTFRQGCRVCGSVRLHSRPLIHHFACAHVGDVNDFEHGNSIICPKCRTRNLIVGADYEYLNGPYRCLDCGWSDTELDLVAECMKCAFRFPLQQAVEEDLIGYDVDRLDPLALIDAS